MHPQIEKSVENLLNVYKTLINLPEPEEEEKARDKLINILENMQENLPDDGMLNDEVNKILEFARQWDVLDRWFTELEELPNLLREFLLQNVPSKVQEILKNSELYGKNGFSEKLSESDSKKPQTLKESSNPRLNVQTSSETHHPSNLDYEMFEDNALDKATQKKFVRKLEKLETLASKINKSSQKQSKTSLPNKKVKKQKLRLEPQEIKQNLQNPDKNAIKSSPSKKLPPPKVEIPPFKIPNIPKKTQNSVRSPRLKPQFTTKHSNSIIDPNKHPISNPVIITHTTPDQTNESISSQKPSSFKFKKIRTKILRENDDVDQNHIPFEKVSPAGLKKLLNSSEAKSNPNQSNTSSSSPENSKYTVNHKININPTDEKPSDQQQQLYQHLMELKSKKHYYEVQLQKLQDNLREGKISDTTFQDQLSEVNYNLLNFNTKISKIQEQLERNI